MGLTPRILVICLVGLCGCGGAPAPEPESAPAPPVRKSPESCDNFKEQMDAVWNNDTLERMDLTVRIYKGELDASDGERIVSEMARLSTRWVSLRTDACRKHNAETTGDDSAYNQLVSCLEGALRDIESRLGRFIDGDLTTLDRIPQTLESCETSP